MNRPATSQAVIDGFARIVDLQDVKGFERYGTTIDEASDAEYNWELMALEETADLQKYLVKRIKQLEKEKEQLLVTTEYLSQQLKKVGTELKEIKRKTRYISYMAMARENLELAERNKQLEEEILKYKE